MLSPERLRLGIFLLHSRPIDVAANGEGAFVSTQESDETTLRAKKLTGGIRHQLIMIVAQFLVGMAVNLVGIPSENGAFGRIAAMVLLMLHILIALDLLVNGILVIVRASGTNIAILARTGAGGIAAAILGGALFFGAAGGWWSYLMAVGTAASLVLYAVAYIRLLRNESAA